MSAPARFMIMTPWGRVGSNLLLNSFGQLIGRIPRRLVNETLNRLPGADDQLAWIRAFYAVDDGAPLVGSKQNILALADRERVGGLLAELEISLIRLRRDNLVKVAVSQLRAEIYAQRSKSETGVAAWGVRPNRQPLGPETLDPARFVQVAADARRAGEWLSDFAPATRTLDLEYADLADGGQSAGRRLCVWLGVEAAGEVKPAFTKATPDDLRAAVPNLAELRAALMGSPLADLEWMFDA